MKKYLVFSLSVFAALFLCAVNAHADPVEPIIKDAALYGNLKLTEIPVWGAQYGCGPAAAVNSFVYLEKKYKDIYKKEKRLIPIQDELDSDLAAVAKELGESYMWTERDKGTWFDWFMIGKSQYIEKQVPRVTRYETQSYWDWGYRKDSQDPPPANNLKPSWFTKATPTWDFIYKQLKKCEDVEIMITGKDVHYITLYGMEWDNTTNKGKIYFVDPAIGQGTNSNIELDKDGKLYTYYMSEREWVGMVVSESPKIPEPGTLLVFGIAMTGLAVAGRMMREK